MAVEDQKQQDSLKPQFLQRGPPATHTMGPPHCGHGSSSGGTQIVVGFSTAVGMGSFSAMFTSA
jgi:hypothetical protein